jgi:hypothetical protein
VAGSYTISVTICRCATARGSRRGRDSHVDHLFVDRLIQRLGVRIGWGGEAGLEPGTLALAHAAWPLMLALILALVLAPVMRETYPR